MVAKSNISKSRFRRSYISKTYDAPGTLLQFDCDFGQLTQYTYGNTVATNRTYSINGLPTAMVTQKTGNTAIFNQTYNFDDIKGLLSARDNETFEYDGLHRLTNYGNSQMKGMIFLLVFNLFFCYNVFAQEDAIAKKTVWDTIIEYALIDLFSDIDVKQKIGDSLLYKPDVVIQDYYFEVVFDKRDSIVLFSDPLNIANRSYRRANSRTKNKLLFFLNSIKEQDEKLPQAILFQHTNYVFSVHINELKRINARYKMTIKNDGIVILGKKIEIIW